MSDRIYIGETVTLAIDLDTSALDADYDLSEATLIYRLALPGAAEADVSASAEVVDAEAGTLTVTLEAEDTGELTPALWMWQLVDTDGPLVLASGSIPALTMLEEPGVS